MRERERGKGGSVQNRNLAISLGLRRGGSPLGIVPRKNNYVKIITIFKYKLAE